jgi:hypothetical protein
MARELGISMELIKIIFNFVNFIATKKGRTNKIFPTTSFLLLLDLRSGIRDPGWKKMRIREKNPGTAVCLFDSLFVIFIATKKVRTTNFSSLLCFAVVGSKIRNPGSGMEENQDLRDKHPGSAMAFWYRSMSFRFSLVSTELVFRWPRWWPASWASAWS